MNAPRVFVDTNVFLYAFDKADPGKSRVASAWIDRLLSEGRARTGLQVVLEFYAQARRAQRFGAKSSEIRAAAASLLAWNPIETNAAGIVRAWEIEDLSSISWWDALIVATAEQSGCVYLLTEDLNHGQRYGSVKAVNPFTQPPGGLDKPLPLN
jgi:predicted nucleic acid-binding protein